MANVIDNNHIPAIYRLMKRLYVRELSEVMDQYDLTRMEMDVLMFLECNPGMDTAAEIVSARCLTKSHVSAAVDHLTELGLLTQRRDEYNRRKIHLTCTPAAKQILEQGRIARDNIAALLTEGVDEAALEQMFATLNMIAKNAEAALNKHEK